MHIILLILSYTDKIKSKNKAVWKGKGRACGKYATSYVKYFGGNVIASGSLVSRDDMTGDRLDTILTMSAESQVIHSNGGVRVCRHNFLVNWFI